jgi:hypothetical protein
LDVLADPGQGGTVKILVAVLLAALVALAPASSAGASVTASCSLISGTGSQYVRIQDGAGLPYRVHDVAGVLRASGVVQAATFYAPVSGPACSAVVLTLGGDSMVLQAEHDDIWQ